MSTLTLRSTKGSPLTNAEVDANFTNLDTDKADKSTVAADLASKLSLSGGTLTGNLLINPNNTALNASWIGLTHGAEIRTTQDASTNLLLSTQLGDVGVASAINVDFACVDTNSVLGAVPQVRIGYTAAYNPYVNSSPDNEAQGWFRIATRTAGAAGTLVDQVIVDPYGNTKFTTSAQAPIFYDTNDTAYYCDPNSETRLASVSVYAGNEAAGAANSSNQGLIVRGNYNSNAYAHKFHKYDNGGGVPLYLSQTTYTGAWTAVQAWGNGLTYNSQVFGSFGADSLYSQVFYDSNDTNYRVDPNGTSNLNTITLANISSNFYVFGGHAGGSGPGIAVENQSTFARIAFWDLDFYDWNVGSVLRLNSYAQSDTSFRAPIFYDSNNTGYYVDPNNTSFLNYLNVGYTGVSTLRPSGAWDNPNFNALVGNHVYYGDIGGASNKPTDYGYQYGTFWDIFPGGAGGAQFYVSHVGNDLCFRGHWGDQAGFATWNRVLTNQNFKSYAVGKVADFPTGNNQNFNDLTQSGYYNIIFGSYSGTANAPPTYSYGTLLVLNAGTFISQLYVAHQTGSASYRVMYAGNNGWTAWQNFA